MFEIVEPQGWLFTSISMKSGILKFREDNLYCNNHKVISMHGVLARFACDVLMTIRYSVTRYFISDWKYIRTIVAIVNRMNITVIHALLRNTDLGKWYSVFKCFVLVVVLFCVMLFYYDLLLIRKSLFAMHLPISIRWQLFPCDDATTNTFGNVYVDL